MTGYSRTLAILSFLTLASAAGSPALAQDGTVITSEDEIGGVYEGTFKGGLQHGTGTYKLPNGYE